MYAALEHNFHVREGDEQRTVSCGDGSFTCAVTCVVSFLLHTLILLFRPVGELKQLVRLVHEEAVKPKVC